MQNYPDQVTEAMRNYADGFVMSEARPLSEVVADDVALGYSPTLRPTPGEIMSY
jgi:hypothetical protein